MDTDDLRRTALADADPAYGLVCATLYLGDQVARVADVLEQMAPAVANGAGEVLGRTLEVAAALRLDPASARVRPAAMDPATERSS